MTTRNPVSPKAHGAWLGASSGAGAGTVAVGLIEQYVTHKALPAADVAAVYWVMSAVLAFAGAWLAPRSGPPPPAMGGEVPSAIINFPGLVDPVYAQKIKDALAKAVRQDPPMRPPA